MTYIKQLYIKRFGKLQEITLSFAEGLNLIYGENEAGKSTICAFLCAMLYSMPNDLKKNSIRENLRTRYTPWTGGTMEGAAVLEKDGREYRIERKIGATKARDKTVIRDNATWEEIDIPDKDEPGRYFLGIGREAFLKTLYAGQLATPITRDKEDEIITRLTNLRQTGEEDTSHQKAMRQLETLRAGLLSSTGRAGELPRMEQELDSLRDELANAQALHRAFGEELCRKKELAARCAALHSELDSLQKQQQESGRMEEFREYQKLTEECERLKQRLTPVRQAEAEEAVKRLENQLAEHQPFDGLTEADCTRLRESKERLEACEAQLNEAEQIREEIGSLQRERDGVRPVKAVNLPMLCIGIAVAALGIAAGLLVHPVLFVLVAVAVFLGVVACMGMNDSKQAVANRQTIDSLLAEKRERLAGYQVERLRAEREKLIDEQNTWHTRCGTSEEQTLREGIYQLASLRQQADAAKRELALIAEGQERVRQDIAQAEERRLALAFTPEELERLRQAGAAENIEEKIAAKHAELVEAEASRREAEYAVEHGMEGIREIASIQEDIAVLEEEAAQLRRKHQALTLAIEALAACYEQRKNDFAPMLGERVRDILLLLSDGRYTDVRVSDDYRLYLKQPGDAEVHEAEYVSGGTYDMVYLALRLGIIKTVMGENVSFLLLDDSFLQYDDKRTATAFAALKHIFPAAQLLYFTCHRQILQQELDAKVIQLSENGVSM